jgi:hypothetical protein
MSRRIRRLYLEGGGNGKQRPTAQELRASFAKLLVRARVPAGTFSVEVCGSIDDAIEAFSKHDDESADCVLVVDSDIPVPKDTDP